VAAVWRGVPGTTVGSNQLNVLSPNLIHNARVCVRIYRMFQKEPAVVWENVSLVKLYRYNLSVFIQDLTFTVIMAK
jgi:hypothetical protein